MWLLIVVVAACSNRSHHSENDAQSPNVPPTQNAEATTDEIAASASAVIDTSNAQEWPADDTRRGSVRALCQRAASGSDDPIDEGLGMDCELAPIGDQRTAPDLAVFEVESPHLILAFLARRFETALEVEEEIAQETSSPEGHVYVTFNVNAIRRSRVGAHDVVLVETETTRTDYDFGGGIEHTVRRLHVCTPYGPRLRCVLRLPLQMRGGEFDSEDGLSRGTEHFQTHRATADLRSEGTVLFRLVEGTWEGLFSGEEGMTENDFVIPPVGTESVVVSFLP